MKAEAPANTSSDIVHVPCISVISEPAQRLSFYGFTAKMIVQGVPHHYKA